MFLLEKEGYIFIRISQEYVLRSFNKNDNTWEDELYYAMKMFLFLIIIFMMNIEKLTKNINNYIIKFKFIFFYILYIILIMPQQSKTTLLIVLCILALIFIAIFLGILFGTDLIIKKSSDTTTAVTTPVTDDATVAAKIATAVSSALDAIKSKSTRMEFTSTADCGYHDDLKLSPLQKGFYDIQNKGSADDFCRWVGDGIGVGPNNTFSCNINGKDYPLDTTHFNYKLGEAVTKSFIGCK